MSACRSFRLFRYSPPEKTALEYSEAEKEQFQRAFEPSARKYRIVRYLSVGLFITFCTLLVAARDHERSYLFWGSAAVYLALYALFKPMCPACRKNVDTSVRAFCPECGSNNISPGGLMRSAECLSCGEFLRKGKGGRSY